MTENIQVIYKVLIGLCVGSFLNVVVYRIPEDISIVKPRSFCPNCKNKIKFKDNIPVISWLIQKGKCSYCGTNINIRYLIIESLTAILFFVFSNSSPHFYNFNQNMFVENIFSWLFLSTLLAISFIDLEHFWIPQSLINFGFLSGLINLTFISILDKDIFAQYFIQGLVASLLSYFLFEILRLIAKKIYKREALGKGDSKLVSMMAIWLGPLGISLGIAISYVIAAIFLMILLRFKKIKIDQMIPFAPFLCTGGITVWYFGNEFLLKLIYRI